MDNQIKFKQFMHKAKTHSKKNITHCAMDGIYKGKYIIDEEKLTEFYYLYSSLVFNMGHSFHFLEMPTKFGPCRIDLDFRFRASMNPQRKYTDNNIDSVVAYYQELFRTYLTTSENDLQAYVFERNCIINSICSNL